MPSKHRFDKGSRVNHDNRQQGLFANKANTLLYRARQKQADSHKNTVKLVVSFEEAMKSVALQTHAPVDRDDDSAAHVNWIVMQLKDAPKFNVVTLIKFFVAILFLSGWRTADALKQPYCLKSSALMPGDRLPNTDVVRTAYANVPVRQNYTLGITLIF